MIPVAGTATIVLAGLVAGWFANGRRPAGGAGAPAKGSEPVNGSGPACGAGSAGSDP
jgi:hypothetical protein